MPLFETNTTVNLLRRIPNGLMYNWEHKSLEIDNIYYL